MGNAPSDNDLPNSGPTNLGPGGSSSSSSSSSAMDDNSTSSGNKRNLRGDGLYREAMQKLNSGGLGSLFSGEQKYDDVIEILEKAAGQYKQSKHWNEAAEVYLRCADLKIKYLKKPEETPDFYINAGKAYKNAGLVQKCLDALNTAIPILMENNRFSSAAAQLKETAKISEADHDYKTAAAAFHRAAEMHFADNGETAGDQCLVQEANLKVKLKEYKAAYELLEQVAKKSAENKLTSWSCKDYYFVATLCRLIDNFHEPEHVGNVHSHVQHYVSSYPPFEQTREYTFVTSLLDAITVGDADKLSDALVEFERYSKVDPDRLSIIYELQKAIKQAEQVVPDLGA